MEVPGVVLKQGESIEATHKFGPVKISYIAPLKRKFEWDGQSRVVKILLPMEPGRSPDPTVTGKPDFVGGLYPPSKEQVNIDVYQLLLNGKKPTNLRGARNNQIKLIKTPIKESKSWF